MIHADRLAAFLATPTPASWGPLPLPIEGRIEPWPWQAAEMSYLRHFHELMAIGSTFGEEDAR